MRGPRWENIKQVCPLVSANDLVKPSTLCCIMVTCLDGLVLRKCAHNADHFAVCWNFVMPIVQYMVFGRPAQKDGLQCCCLA